MDASSSEGEPDPPAGEENLRRSDRKRRPPPKYLSVGDEEIELTDEEELKPNDEEEIDRTDEEEFEPNDEESESSEEDQKPVRKKKNKKKKTKKTEEEEEEEAEAPRSEAAPAPAVEVVEGPVFPADFAARVRELKGNRPILVFQKKLFNTDVKKNQNRLSIPLNQIKVNFLTDDENLRVAEGMTVKMIEPFLQESEILFKKWKMKETCYVYVLMKQWNSVVERNELKKGDTVQVWSFRVDSVLWFALVKVPAD